MGTLLIIQHESEVLEVQGSQVLVHFNCRHRSRDEWIDADSPRIAAFRTHSVPNIESKHLSPSPNKLLDGVYELPQGQRDLAESLLGPDDMLEQFASHFESLGAKMTRLAQVKRERVVLLKKIDVLKGKKSVERGAGTHSVKAKKNTFNKISKVFGTKRESYRPSDREIYSTFD